MSDEDIEPTVRVIEVPWDHRFIAFHICLHLGYNVEITAKGYPENGPIVKTAVIVATKVTELERRLLASMNDENHHA